MLTRSHLFEDYSAISLLSLRQRDAVQTRAVNLRIADQRATTSLQTAANPPPTHSYNIRLILDMRRDAFYKDHPPESLRGGDRRIRIDPMSNEDRGLCDRCDTEL